MVEKFEKGKEKKNPLEKKVEELEKKFEKSEKERKKAKFLSNVMILTLIAFGGVGIWQSSLVKKAEGQLKRLQEVFEKRKGEHVEVMSDKEIIKEIFKIVDERMKEEKERKKEEREKEVKFGVVE